MNFVTWNIIVGCVVGIALVLWIGWFTSCSPSISYIRVGEPCSADSCCVIGVKSKVITVDTIKKDTVIYPGW